MNCKYLLVLILTFLSINSNVYCFYSYFASSVLSVVYEEAACIGQRLMFKHCCNRHELLQDFDGLAKSLKDKVYGQPLVENVLVKALKYHWDAKLVPAKALTLSFHGGPGLGKNYVTKFILNNLYRKGAASPFVHYFNSRIDFPELGKVAEYKKTLKNRIQQSTTSCPYQTFVFDEVDKMPPGVLDIIKPFIDYNELVDGVSYKRCIFIFLSNTGAHIITNFVIKLWRAGVSRHDLQLRDFEMMVARGAFNEEGGFYRSDTIRSNLIDHYIPFIPLEREHIELCIKDEFRMRDVENPPKKHIEEILAYMEWGPDPDEIFSKTGCKRISQKVNILL